MSYNEERINNLSVKLNSLIRRHKDYTEEIKQLRAELQALKDGRTILDNSTTGQVTPKPVKKSLETERVVDTAPVNPATSPSPLESRKQKKQKATSSFNWEKFIGENLISKLGVLIIIIGVAIGTKYSIDNGLLSPLTRIILGYVVGVALLGVGFKLKEKYIKYSSVLVSGAMVINFFVTFIAYNLFELFSKEITFGLMVLFTIFTVLASWHYKKQVIAVIGLVGAYATPFLLSDGSGNVAFLFSYVAIINLGILAVAVKQDWKLVNYLAFFFTWAVYGAFYSSDYLEEAHFSLCLIFTSLFFMLFYVTFIVNKFINGKQFKIEDVILITLNSFAFFGFVFALLSENEAYSSYLGLFTLANAVIHFIVSFVAYKKKLVDPVMTDYIIALVFVFVAIAVPVQLDGNWVTLLWSFIALSLFVIGRWREAKIYEILSYPLLLLGLGSLLQDWDYSYFTISEFKPVFNATFLTSMLVIGVLGTLLFIDQKMKLNSVATKDPSLRKVITGVFAGLIILLPFTVFFREIGLYFQNIYDASALSITENDYERNIYNRNLLDLETVWLVVYTMIYAISLSLINKFFVRNSVLTKVSSVINSSIIFIFLAAGLYAISELRANYLNQYQGEYYSITSFNLAMRYVALGVFAVLVFLQYLNTRKEELSKIPATIIDIALSVIILWVTTSELIHWIDLFNPEKAYKLGVTILWGVFALACVSIGIFKKRAHLRIGAIVLFAVTLIKLFSYDIPHLSTIQKVIVIVVLGVLLLIISFLYNKYKDRISDENNS